MKRYKLIISLVIGVLTMVGAVGLVVYVQTRPDPGIVACEMMAENSGPVSSNNDQMTRQDYLDAREVFTKSKHKDIRDAGTKFVDAAWQIQGNDDIVGMLFIQQVTGAYQNLAAACANHKIVLPSLSTIAK